MFPHDVIDVTSAAEGEGDDDDDDGGVGAASDRRGEAGGGVAVELVGLDPVLEKLKVRVLTCCPGGWFPASDVTKEFLKCRSVESPKSNA